MAWKGVRYYYRSNDGSAWYDPVTRSWLSFSALVDLVWQRHMEEKAKLVTPTPSKKVTPTSL